MLLLLADVARQQAPQAGELLGSAGLLGAILGGGLLASMIAAYRFAVNFRTTERSLRGRETRDRRAALYEAGQWQARAADLEYMLRRHGVTVPPVRPELQKLINEADDPTPPLPQWDGPSKPDERSSR